MPGRNTTVFVTRRLPIAIETRMADLFDFVVRDSDTPLSSDELLEAMKNCDVFVPTITDKITAAMIKSAGNRLKMIANYGNGFNNIDAKAALECGIIVTNTPGVLTEDTADMTIALMLAVPRRIVEGAEILKQDKPWAGWSPTWMLGHRIYGKKLGIIGMGRIGRAVAKRAHAFGLEIHYHNRRALPQQDEAMLNARYWENLEAMLGHVDIVSIHCPATPATYHLLSERRLQRMKSTATLINTARGDIVDEKALARLIEEGRIAGAGIDVFEREPEINSKLIRLARMNKIVLLPHMSSATLESRIEMGERVIINIKTHADGHRPPDRVLPHML